MRRPAAQDAVSDTDVLSFAFNRDPVRAPRYADHFRGVTIYVSVVTYAEMRFGALQRNWGRARIEALEAFFADYEIVDPNQNIGRIWAKIRVESQRVGRTIERQDAWIAATALHLDVPLITHNAAHFEHLPQLRLITEPDVRATPR